MTNTIQKTLFAIFALLLFTAAPVTGQITGESGTQVVVYNPLAWNRTDIVDMPSPFCGENVKTVTVADGTATYPAQIVADRIIFTARNVPALDYKIFRLIKSDKPAATSIKTTNDYIENEYFRVKFDLSKGIIKRIYDKINKRVVASQTGVLQIVINKQIMDLDPDETEVLEIGPTRAMARLEHTYGKSSFVQDVVLYEGVPRIDIKLTAYLQQQAALEVTFPTALSCPKAIFDIPCRTNAQKWIDLSEDKYGISILNYSKYTCSVTNNIVHILIPTDLSGQRIYEAAYSIYPHSGNCSTGFTSHCAVELNNPLSIVARSCKISTNTQ
ncbi:MAG: glycoside hydrolase family 38 C-terminal domain-containing protein [Armatimonadota bacterium]